MKNVILQGDALTKLKELPGQSVNMCMTSPPYWALRDYGTASWEGGDNDCDHKTGRDTRTIKNIKESSGSYGDEAVKNGENCPKCGAKRVDKQLGLEPTFDKYISDLCDIFDGVKRVLRDDGTCWVNLGDTYFGSGKGAGGDGKNKESFTFTEKEERTCDNCSKKFNGWKFQNFCGSACSGVDNTPRSKKGKLPDKTLTMIPMRFAIEMVNRGWILRNTIIWHKPNAMPSSVKDRFTVDFEYVFLFSKQKKYYFEQQLDPYTSPVDRWGGETVAKYNGKFSDKDDNDNYNSPRARCSRPNYPERKRTLRPNPAGKNKRTLWSINTKPYKEAHFAVYPEELCETPIKAGCPEGGIVLDPFFGAGTTGLVALKQNKNYIGIELNPEYIKIAEKRLKPIQEQSSLNLNNTKGDTE